MINDTKWMALGACRGLPVDLFFEPDEVDDPAKDPREPTAVQTQRCTGCPVKTECFNWALNQGDELYGTWGGTTRYQRRQMRVKRDRATCPMCHSDEIIDEGRGQVCLSCGGSWLAPIN